MKKNPDIAETLEERELNARAYALAKDLHEFIMKHPETNGRVALSALVTCAAWLGTALQYPCMLVLMGFMEAYQSAHDESEPGSSGKHHQTPSGD